MQTFPDEYQLWEEKVIRSIKLVIQFHHNLLEFLRYLLLTNFSCKSDINISYLSANEKLGFRRRKAQLTNHYKATAKKALLSVSKEITGAFDSKFTSKVHWKRFSFKFDQKDGFHLESKVKNNTWSISIYK